MVDLKFKSSNGVLQVLINGQPDRELRFDKDAWEAARKNRLLTPDVIGLTKQRVRQAVRDTPMLTPEQQQQVVQRFFEEIDG